jgi:hypothetical protein
LVSVYGSLIIPKNVIINTSGSASSQRGFGGSELLTKSHQDKYKRGGRVYSSTRSKLMEMMKVSQIPKIELFKPITMIKSLDLAENKDKKKWMFIFRSRENYRLLRRYPRLLNLIYGVPEPLSRNLIKVWVQEYETMVNNKGAIEAVKSHKTLNEALMRFATNHTFTPFEFKTVCRDGIPIGYRPFTLCIKSPIKGYRQAALAILQLWKIPIVPGPLPSITTITDPFTGDISDSGTPFIGKFLDQACRSAMIDTKTSINVVREFRNVLEIMFPFNKRADRLLDISSNSKLHLSHKNGPNGTCVGTIPVDFKALSNDNDLISALLTIGTLTANDHLLESLSLFSKTNQESTYSTKGTSPSTSSLSIKNEKGVKGRIFAICDIFSQSSLKGFHDWAASWLRFQPEDGTANQDHVKRIAQKWTIDNSIELNGCSNLTSTDLSAATDRLPALFQREIMQAIAGKEFADAWYVLCTNRTFTSRFYEPVQYAVGQPMGLYSSWAMLAITHHVICRLTLRLSNIKRDRENPHFIIIGDDQANRNEEFSRIYLMIIRDILKVPVNQSKGFRSETVSGVNPLFADQNTSVCEIAKVVYYNGLNMSGPSPEAFKQGFSMPSDFINLLETLLMDETLTNFTTSENAPILLACMGWNPDKNFLLATYPGKTAMALTRHPVWGVIIESSIVGDPLDPSHAALLDLVPWFKYPGVITPEYLDRKLYKLMEQDSEKAYQNCITSINGFIDRSTQGGKIKEWLYVEQKGFTYYCKCLLKQLQNSYYSSILTRKPYEEVGDMVRMRKTEAANNRTLLDLTDYFDGKPRSEKLTKKQTESKSFAALVKSVSKDFSSSPQVKTDRSLTFNLINDRVPMFVGNITNYFSS